MIRFLIRCIDRFLRMIENLILYKDSFFVMRRLKRIMEMQKEFEKKKIEHDDLQWLLRRMENYDFKPISFMSIIKWVRQQMQEIKDRNEQRALESIERKKKVPGIVADALTVDEPAIKDDAILILEELEGILEQMRNKNSRPEMDPVGEIKKRIDQTRMNLSQQMEWMICQSQVDLEKIKKLVCQGEKEPSQADWTAAADLFIPMWETVMERGIKHEICTHSKFLIDEEDNQESFYGGISDIDDLRIETREEREARERMEKSKSKQ